MSRFEEQTAQPRREAAEVPTLTVSQLNRQVRTLLENGLAMLRVEGEISNFAAPASGHWYFSLKDDGAQVRCAMFRNRNQLVRLRPANGVAVLVRGRVSLYESRGDYQLIVEHLESAGTGALQRRFEALSRQLAAEGLFAQDRKRPLPLHPWRVAVITSPTGAAIHDFVTVFRRRCPLTELFIVPVPVQGDAAAPAIREAIARTNRWNRSGDLAIDVIVLCRGGGSLEDLWAFNEESVARAIHASELPVVSAVGHETDVTIADLAADQRAPTPSAAAELLSPDLQQWQLALDGARLTLARQLRRKLSATRRELGHLRRRLQHPGARLRDRTQRADELELRLRRALALKIATRREIIGQQAQRLRRASPAIRLQRRREHLGVQRQRLTGAVMQRHRAARSRVAALARVLDGLSPLAVLGRGYSILQRREGGQVVRDASAVRPGQRLRARLQRGFLDLAVEDVQAPGEPDQG